MDHAWVVDVIVLAISKQVGAVHAVGDQTRYARMQLPNTEQQAAYGRIAM